MEDLGENTEDNEATPEVTEERKKIVEEIFRTRHDRLIGLCTHILMKSHYLTYNPDRDAEEIVAQLYEILLRTKTPPDLTRDEHELKAYLNKILYDLVRRRIEMAVAEKRIPEENLVSLEEIFGEDNEDEIESRLKQHFTKHTTNDTEAVNGEEHLINDQTFEEVDRAIQRLEGRNPKMANIIKKRYKEEKTLQEIADCYGDTRENIRKLEGKALELIQKIVSGKIQSDLSIPIERILRKKNKKTAKSSR